MTAAPTVAPAPPLVPSPIAMPVDELFADTLSSAPVVFTTALPVIRAYVFVVMPIVATAASVLLSVLPESAVMSATIFTVEVACMSSLLVAVTWLEPPTSTSAVEKPRMKASFATLPTSRLLVVVSIVESASSETFAPLRSPSTVTVACVASAAKLCPDTPSSEFFSDAWSVMSCVPAASEAPADTLMAESDWTFTSKPKVPAPSSWTWSCQRRDCRPPVKLTLNPVERLCRLARSRWIVSPKKAAPALRDRSSAPALAERSVEAEV